MSVEATGRWSRYWPGAALGVVAAAVALGTAELVAAAVGPQSSPVIAVSGGVIDLTPRPLEQFAIRTFGESDKAVLIAGVLVLLAVFAMAIGLLAMWRPAVGLAGIVLFGVVGVAAAATRPDAGQLDVLPSVAGAGAGALALSRLVSLLPKRRGVSPPVRPTEAEPVDVNRRRFLATGGILLAGAAIGGGLGRALIQRFDVSGVRAALRLPKPASPAPALPAGASLTEAGLTPFHTPNRDFYRVDTALLLPQVDPETWRLRIHGRVREPMTLTFDDLVRRNLIERDITISCVSNEIGGDLAGNARWLGVPLKDLLDEAQPDDDADQIVSTSADGWTCGTPTASCRDGRDAMLAVAMNGEPLPVRHGFPVRMVVPGLYGYVSATKWVVDLELSRFEDFDAYWVRRGWAARASIKTFSRIDTPSGTARPRAGLVTVAGVAWAQHRGIDKVEVRVDGGPWHEAELAVEASVDTWRQWRWQWQASAGEHRLECRATDRTGTPQTEKRRPPLPDGATGWHTVDISVG